MGVWGLLSVHPFEGVGIQTEHDANYFSINKWLNYSNVKLNVLYFRRGLSAAVKQMSSYICQYKGLPLKFSSMKIKIHEAQP